MNGMNPKLLLVLLAIILAGCASTVVKSRTGHVLLRTQADAARVTFYYAGGGEVIDCAMEQPNHSVPTRAGGSVVGTTFSGATSLVMAGVSKGLIH